MTSVEPGPEGVLLIEEPQRSGAPDTVENRAQVAAHGGLGDLSRKRPGMVELQTQAVQKGAVQPVFLGEIAVRRGVAVAFVPEHGMADGRKVAT